MNSSVQTVRADNVVRVLGAILCVLLCSLSLFSQVTTGTIFGTVQDSSGAAIPGATVTIRNLDTGMARSVTTDEGGRYTAPDLSLGNYEVQAKLMGFQTEVRRGITLTVGRQAVVNLSLRVGQVNEQVTVTGEAPLVEATSSTLSSLVDDRTIRELPLSGRSYDRLALLQPGIVWTPFGTTNTPSLDYGTGFRFSVSGSRTYANSFLLDGTGINDHPNATPGGASGNNLGVEGVLEFKVISSMASAEYGWSSGGVITAVTRSGTNNLHGSVFEFFRNNKLDARDFFTQGPTTPFRRNQFGGALGGPIQKDKTFFFGTYEGMRQGRANPVVATVPTVAAKHGILPGLPPFQVNPVMQRFVNLYPDPNGTDFGDGTAYYFSSPVQPTNEDYFMIRVDHQISDKMSIFGRYSFDNDENMVPEYMNLPTFREQDQARRQYSTFQVLNTLQPNVVNSFRFAFNRTFQYFDDVPNQALGPEFSFIPGQTMGTVQVGGSAGTGAGLSRAVTPLGVDTGAPRIYRYNLFETGDDLTYVKGSHSFKTGADIRRLDDNAESDALTRGVYAFDNLRALLLGTPSTPDGFQAVQPGQNGYRGFRQSFLGFYGQDDFKVSPRLTLNLGLRWEAATNPKDVNGKMSNLLNLTDTKPTVLTGSYFDITKKDFQPRIGLAWQLNESGTTVLRAGFGIYHDHLLPYSYANFVSRQPPFYNSLSSGNAVPQFPNGAGNLAAGGVASLTPFPTVIKEPTKNSYNVNLQRQLVKDMLLEVAYIGSQSHHLQGSGEQNTPVPTFVNGQPTFAASGPLVRINPNFSSVRYYRFDTNASYNALQATLRRRSASGLQYQASYTFSKSMDLKSILTNGDTRQEPGTFMDPLNPSRDRGLSTFYAKHNFILTTTYPFPFRFQQKAAQLVLGGWTINGIGTFRSGNPFTVRTGFNRSRNGDTQSADRPNLRPGFSNSPTSGTSPGCLNTDGTVAIAPGTKLGTPNHYFDPCAFSLEDSGTYGNLGRDTVIGPKLINVDASLEKTFKPREAVSVQFRAESFNFLNHPNFGLPANSVFTSAGKYIGSAGSITTTTTQGRTIQFGLKVIF
jgi:hypothetical protein